MPNDEPMFSGGAQTGVRVPLYLAGCSISVVLAAVAVAALLVVFALIRDVAETGSKRSLRATVDTARREEDEGIYPNHTSKKAFTMHRKRTRPPRPTQPRKLNRRLPAASRRTSTSDMTSSTQASNPFLPRRYIRSSTERRTKTTRRRLKQEFNFRYSRPHVSTKSANDLKKRTEASSQPLSHTEVRTTRTYVSTRQKLRATGALLTTTTEYLGTEADTFSRTAEEHQAESTMEEPTTSVLAEYNTVSIDEEDVFRTAQNTRSSVSRSAFFTNQEIFTLPPSYSGENDSQYEILTTTETTTSVDVPQVELFKDYTVYPEDVLPGHGAPTVPEDWENTLDWGNIRNLVTGSRDRKEQTTGTSLRSSPRTTYSSAADNSSAFELTQSTTGSMTTPRSRNDGGHNEIHTTTAKRTNGTVPPKDTTLSREPHNTMDVGIPQSTLGERSRKSIHSSSTGASQTLGNGRVRPTSSTTMKRLSTAASTYTRMTTQLSTRPQTRHRPRRGTVTIRVDRRHRKKYNLWPMGTLPRKMKKFTNQLLSTTTPEIRTVSKMLTTGSFYGGDTEDDEGEEGSSDRVVKLKGETFANHETRGQGYSSHTREVNLTSGILSTIVDTEHTEPFHGYNLHSYLADISDKREGLERRDILHAPIMSKNFHDQSNDLGGSDISLKFRRKTTTPVFTEPFQEWEAEVPYGSMDRAVDTDTPGLSAILSARRTASRHFHYHYKITGHKHGTTTKRTSSKLSYRTT
ncbi:uncharacterized protein LOC135399790 [Ornithodoros turicata]|uniref:uncharacterized protein LOC135399790 n=1 Tax=Ornithodoros turicata TaxID=34597 RepID=UPI00313A2AC9